MEVRVQLPDITAAEAVKAEATQLPAHALQQVSESIVQLTEEVVEILRAQATHAVRRRKKRTELWLDDLTETQGNTVIATKQLCEKSPHGTTLKKLAETIGVTPAAASVKSFLGRRSLLSWDLTSISRSSPIGAAEPIWILICSAVGSPMSRL